MESKNPIAATAVGNKGGIRSKKSALGNLLQKRHQENTDSETDDDEPTVQIVK